MLRGMQLSMKWWKIKQRFIYKKNELANLCAREYIHICPHRPKKKKKKKKKKEDKRFKKLILVNLEPFELIELKSHVTGHVIQQNGCQQDAVLTRFNWFVNAL